MLPEKKTLCLEEIEAQTALELPDRELLQTSFTVSPFIGQSTGSGVNALNNIAALNQLVNANALNCLSIASAGGSTCS